MCVRELLTVLIASNTDFPLEGVWRLKGESEKLAPSHFESVGFDVFP